MNTEGIIAQISRIRETANTLIEAELRNRSISGVVPAHGPVLMFLFQQTQPVPIKTVVENVRRVKSTITVMINTLERYGILSKQPSDSDNRVTLVSLTPKGRELKKDFEDISNVLLDQVYGKMSKNDRQMLVSLLNTIEMNMKA